MTHPTITQDQVRHVAKLSRLKLTEEQLRFYTQKLSHVLEYVGKLNELNVDGVEPMAHPTAMTNKFREDIPTPAIPVEQALANAPDSDPPFFKVPKVFGDDPGV